VLNNGALAPVQIQTGSSDGTNTVVLSGLQPGAPVVTGTTSGTSGKSGSSSSGNIFGFGPPSGGNNNRSGGLGGPPPATATPTATPSPTPALLPADSVVEPGRYRLASNGLVGSAPATLSITVPSGWASGGSVLVNKNYGSKDYGADAGAAFGVWQISNRFNHPCTDHTLFKPAPGPGTAGLLDALASQPGIKAGPIADVTVDGYSGKYVELTVATDIATCPVTNGDGPLGGFWLWASPDGDRRYVQGSDETDRIYAVDVDGKRQTFFARILKETTAADSAELQAIIDSIAIEAPSSPTPS